MNPKLTHVTVVLDRSGSMSSIASDVIGGHNRFVQDQKNAPGDCTFSLIQFDTVSMDWVYRAEPIAHVGTLGPETFQPRGGTPLYDALAHAIIYTGDYLKAIPEARRPGKVVFVVITDGLENSSRQFSQTQVRDMIRHQTEAYKWEFVFLGANIDSYAVAGNLGVQSSHTMNYACNTTSVSAMFADTSSNLRSLRSGLKSDMSYEPEQLDKQIKAGADQTRPVK